MKTITAYFRNGRAVTYTTAILELLKTDPDVAYIMDDETGEVLYIRTEF